MREKPEWLSPGKIEPQSYSELFILSYLTCPEDGQPENFKVQMLEDKSIRYAVSIWDTVL